MYNCMYIYTYIVNSVIFPQSTNQRHSSASKFNLCMKAVLVWKLTSLDSNTFF